MKKHLLIILVMAAMAVLATTACGSDTAMTPQNNEPVIETTTPEPTPTSIPDVPENVVPVTPEEPPAQVNPAVSSGRGNTAGNLANTGLAAYSNGRIYFIDSGGTNNLYSMNIDGSDIQMLAFLGRSSSINVIGDYVYFSAGQAGIVRANINGGDVHQHLFNISGNSPRIINNNIIHIDRSDRLSFIYNANIDGSNRRRINSGYDYIYNITVSDNRVYFTTPGETRGSTILHSVDFDGLDEQTVLLSDTFMEHIFYYDGRLFFRGNGIESINIDGSDRRQIVDSQNVTSRTRFNIHEDVLYFSRDRSIYSVNMDGSDQRQLADTDIRIDSGILIAGGRIFIADRDIDTPLYSMNLDGSNLRRVIE